MTGSEAEGDQGAVVEPRMLCLRWNVLMNVCPRLQK